MELRLVVTYNGEPFVASINGFIKKVGGVSPSND
jgi:hypothetical protein